MILSEMAVPFVSNRPLARSPNTIALSFLVHDLATSLSRFRRAADLAFFKTLKLPNSRAGCGPKTGS